MTYSPEELLARALNWMRARNWHKKLAKSATGQSLLEHTLIELDVFLTLEPVLSDPSRFALTTSERSTILASLLCHDVGKESDEWQRYVRTPGASAVPHIDRDLTRRVAPDVCRVLGFESLTESVQRTVELCARDHHSRPGRRDAILAEAFLDSDADSFTALAQIVKDVDRLCSAQTAQSAVAYLRSSDLGKHLIAEWHQINIRGVSSALLHKAAQQAFEANGWRPLIYFAEATVYSASRTSEHAIPGSEAIRKGLETILGEALKREVSNLMVGNPTANILPKPDLVSWEESRRYLEQAGRKMSATSFAKKKLDDRAKVVSAYLQLRESSSTKITPASSGDTGAGHKPSSQEVDLQSQRISRAQPEMVVFKLFKALTDSDKIPGLSARSQKIAELLYEEVFGPGTWAKLQSTSTLMPARDMVATVDHYWCLDAAAIGRTTGIKVETLPDQDRMDGLVTLLDGIIQKIVRQNHTTSPRSELAANMASAFVSDFVRPADVELRSFAASQCAHYSESKPVAGKEKSAASYICPVCNTPFAKGRKASADLIDNPQGHTNRGNSHGSFGYIMVCESCYYERLLRQILMGKRPAEIIVMTPPWNVGARNGNAIVKEVHSFVDQASQEMRGDSDDLSTGISFGLTDQIAQRLDEASPDEINGARVLGLFRYKFGADTIRKRLRQVEKRLRDDYGNDLELLNRMCGSAFETWEQAAGTTCRPGKLPHDELEDVRREVLRLYPSLTLICETPNLIFIPLAYPIAGGADESLSNRALRRLVAALTIHKAFRTAVAIHPEPEQIEVASGSGAAWVPPVPAVRGLIGSDWVGADQADIWLRHITAAARLAPATGYSPRSALFETITADPAESILRRIESHRGSATASQVKLIRSLPFFRTSGLYGEEL